jgi:hypothetical protein
VRLGRTGDQNGCKRDSTLACKRRRASVGMLQYLVLSADSGVYGGERSIGEGRGDPTGSDLPVAR